MNCQCLLLGGKVESEDDCNCNFYPHDPMLVRVLAMGLCLIIIIKRQLISRRNMPEDITRECLSVCHKTGFLPKRMNESSCVKRKFEYLQK